MAVAEAERAAAVARAMAAVKGGGGAAALGAIMEVPPPLTRGGGVACGGGAGGGVSLGRAAGGERVHHLNNWAQISNWDTQVSGKLQVVCSKASCSSI